MALPDGGSNRLPGHATSGGDDETLGCVTTEILVRPYALTMINQKATICDATPRAIAINPSAAGGNPTGRSMATSPCTPAPRPKVRHITPQSNPHATLPWNGVDKDSRPSRKTAKWVPRTGLPKTERAMILAATNRYVTTLAINKNPETSAPAPLRVATAKKSRM